MAEFISLRGRAALSPFRLAKLQDNLAAANPAHRIRGLAATFWHFVEIARALAASERDKLERLLIYGPKSTDAADVGTPLLVVPRPGTISPWSSKATDIARNCGLDAIVRIERGIAFRVATVDGEPLAPADRAALLPLIHDRMIEAVFDELGDARQLFAHFPPRPLTTIPLLTEGRAALEAANVALGLALAQDEVDYLDAGFRALNSTFPRNPTGCRDRSRATGPTRGRLAPTLS